MSVKYNISVFTNEPKLREREYYFDSLSEALTWVKKQRLGPIDNSQHWLEADGYLGIELNETDYNKFLEREQ